MFSQAGVALEVEGNGLLVKLSRPQLQDLFHGRGSVTAQSDARGLAINHAMTKAFGGAPPDQVQKIMHLYKVGDKAEQPSQVLWTTEKGATHPLHRASTTVLDLIQLEPLVNGLPLVSYVTAVADASGVVFVKGGKCFFMSKKSLFSPSLFKASACVKPGILKASHRPPTPDPFAASA